jgi:menaquinone-dependent protoporphyrinogen IX oxidase
MIIRQEIDLDDVHLTDEEKQMLESLANVEPEPTEDCPELTPEQLDKMVLASEIDHKKYNKKTVSLRLSPQAISQAKFLDKKYRKVLSKMLENILSNPELVKLCLK